MSTVYEAVTCDRCAAPLPLSDLAEEGALSPELGLVLRFTGGLGMFCDPVIVPGELDPEFDKVFCHACAHEVAAYLGVDVASWHDCAEA